MVPSLPSLSYLSSIRFWKGKMERHEKSPRFVAQSFGDMVQSPRESAWLPDVEVFSQSAKARLPGRVSLLAAPGKITVCYSLEALCAKHMKHCSKFCKATSLLQAATCQMRFNSPLNWAFRDWSQKKFGSTVQRFLEFMTRSDTARARSVASISARLHR